MAISDRQLLDSLSRMPFADSAELAGTPGEPHATIHRGLTGLLADGIVGRVSHGTAHQTSLELSDRASFGSIPLRKDRSQSYNSRVALWEPRFRSRSGNKCGNTKHLWLYLYKSMTSSSSTTPGRIKNLRVVVHLGSVTLGRSCPIRRESAVG